MSHSLTTPGEKRFVGWILAAIIVLSFVLVVLDQRSAQESRGIPAAVKP